MRLLEGGDPGESVVPQDWSFSQGSPWKVPAEATPLPCQTNSFSNGHIWASARKENYTVVIPVLVLQPKFESGIKPGGVKGIAGSWDRVSC